MGEIRFHGFNDLLEIHSGSEREAATLALLQKFQAKLSVAREGTSSENEEKTKATDDAKTDETWYAINIDLTQLDFY